MSPCNSVNRLWSYIYRKCAIGHPHLPQVSIVICNSPLIQVLKTARERIINLIKEKHIGTPSKMLSIYFMQHTERNCGAQNGALGDTVTVPPYKHD